MLSLMLALAVTSASADDERFVVAVFPIQDSSGRVETGALDQLTDYLGVKITEGGSFLVVPRKDITAALANSKQESYRACYDQACQIEIGKELAAQKILHTQIVQVGDQCAVTGTLYDLRIAATDKATAHKSGCTENELVVSLENVARQLTSAVAEPQVEAPPAEVAPPAPVEDTGPKFGLKLDSEPAGADVLVDGRFVGQTPARVSVTAAEKHRLTIQHDGYEDFSEEVELNGDTKRSVALRLTPEHRAGRHEWVGLSAAASVTLSGATGAGAWIRIANLHFGSISWTAAELFLGFLSTEDLYVENCPLDQARARGFCSNGTTSVALGLGTRPGWTFSLDEEGVHALEASLGVGLYVIEGGTDEFAGFSLSPSVRYLHRGDGSFVYGGGLRLVLPMGSDSCDNSQQTVSRFIECEYRQPTTLQLEVPFGWYL